MIVNRNLTRVREVEALVEWLASMRFTHLATFNFNARATPTSIRTALRRAHVRIDRKLHGRHFHLLSCTQRTFFVGFIEHLHSNTHCHALLRSPAVNFSDVAPKIWSKIVPSGQLHLQSPPTRKDLFLEEMGIGQPQALSIDNIVRIARYITKEAHTPQQYESFVLSTEFSAL